MGSAELKDEYQALRQEILHRFEKVYDAEKYGFGSILALIGYLCLGPSKPLEAITALMLLESLILILSIFVMNEFMMIYRLGTYIALFSEGKDKNSAKWVRMSRRDRDCLQAINCNLSKSKLKAWYIYGWGSDSQTHACALLVLLLASWVSTLPALNWKIFFPILLLFVISVNLYWLICGVKIYRKTTEENWMKVRKAWGNTFPDPYENGTNTE